MSSGTRVTLMHCRGCGYSLLGLSDTRCPECGRRFDPADPGSYDQYPRRSGLRRWVRRAGGSLSVAAALAVLAYACLYALWRPEHDAATAVANLGGTVSTGSHGPPWLGEVLNGRLGHLDDRVETVNLRDTGAGDDALTTIAGLRHNKKLILSYTNVSDAWLARLAGQSQLRSVELIGTGVTGEGLRHLTSLHGLEELHLGSKITDADLVHLRAWPNLKRLGLSNNRQITDAGLVQLKNVPQLEFLALHATEVTDDGLVHIGALNRLEMLVLSQTYVTDAGLVHLTGLKNLRRFGVGGSTRVTDDGLQTLKAAAPGVHVFEQW